MTLEGRTPSLFCSLRSKTGTAIWEAGEPDSNSRAIEWPPVVDLEGSDLSCPTSWASKSSQEHQTPEVQTHPQRSVLASWFHSSELHFTFSGSSGVFFFSADWTLWSQISAPVSALAEEFVIGKAEVYHFPTGIFYLLGHYLPPKELGTEWECCRLNPFFFPGPETQSAL